MAWKVLLGSIICIFMSCSSNECIDGMEVFQSNSDTVEKDIPGYLQSPGSIEYKLVLERAMGIKSIENGLDGYEIRVWYELDPYSGNLYRFSKLSEQNWIGERYDYNYTDDAPRQAIPKIKRFQLREPNSGWCEFINGLCALGILNLQDSRELKDYDQLGTDEVGVAIELASKSKYRMYAYLTPGYWQKRYQQAKKIVQIMDKIRANFP